MKKIKEIWKDPVWSKVIAAGILFIIAGLWAIYIDLTIKQIYFKFITFLNYNIPIYFCLIIIFIYLFSKFIYKKLKKKDLYFNEIIGNYNFGELCEVLMNKKPTGTTWSMNYGGESTPDIDLLTLFYNYYSYFNRGIKLEDDYNDRGFIYGILCPEFVGYGLLDKMENKNDKIDLIEITYGISDNGKKFHSLLERSKMF